MTVVTVEFVRDSISSRQEVKGQNLDYKSLVQAFSFGLVKLHVDVAEVYSSSSILLHYNKLPTNNVRETNMKKHGELGEMLIKEKKFGDLHEMPRRSKKLGNLVKRQMFIDI